MGYVQLGLRGRQQSSTRWKPLQNRKPTGWAKALASGKRAPIGIFWHTSAERFAGRVQHQAAILAASQVPSDVTRHPGAQPSFQVLTDQTGCFLASQNRTFGISPLTFPRSI